MDAQKVVFHWPTIAADPAKHRPQANLDHFTHVRLYHFCRPTNFDGYRQYGIRLFQHRELSDKFHAMFSDVPSAARDKAVEEALKDRLPPRIDAALDDRYMTQFANLYAALGSEMIQGFCANLSR